MSTLTLRQTALLVVLFVATSLTFIALDNRQALDPVRGGLADLLMPVASGFTRIARGPVDSSALGQELARVTAERDRLMAENARLQAENTQLDELQEVLAVQEDNPNRTYLPARVISRDPSTFELFVIIDKGSDDGVQLGMAVTDPTYYVGLVTDVEADRSKVTLVTDVSQRIGAKLLQQGADGIVAGRWQQGGRLQMDYVSREVIPEEREIVMTSDIAASQTVNVPPDIIIGIVNGEPVRNPQTDSLTFPVYPMADLDNLDVVAVVIPDGEN